LNENRHIDRILLALRIFSVFSIIILAIIIGHYWGKVSVEDIINYVPKNYCLAAITIICLFMIKSLSIVLPLMVLYISSGIIFSPKWGVLVNLVGLFVSLSLPYFIGKFCGKGLIEKLLIKYKNIEKLESLKTKNECFFSYILRMIGILPSDIVSMSLGAMNINYIKYIFGSIVGLLPRMIATTFLGGSITEPTSPIFILSCIMTVIITLLSFLIHHIFVKKKMQVI
jgi:uncharacterized membrane protein YdjX (TVP38/TMEM64 family)